MLGLAPFDDDGDDDNDEDGGGGEGSGGGGQHHPHPQPPYHPKGGRKGKNIHSLRTKFLIHNSAGESSINWIRMDLSKSLTYAVASSDVCTVPLAATDKVVSSDLRIVSCSSEVKSFLPRMCIEAPESTTHSIFLCPLQMWK